MFLGFSQKNVLTVARSESQDAALDARLGAGTFYLLCRVDVVWAPDVGPYLFLPCFCWGQKYGPLLCICYKIRNARITD